MTMWACRKMAAVWHAWVQALELLHGAGHAPVALRLLAVGLGFAELRLQLLQLLRQDVPLRPDQHQPISIRDSKKFAQRLQFCTVHPNADSGRT